MPADADDVVVAAHAVVFKPAGLVGGDVSTPQWASAVLAAGSVLAAWIDGVNTGLGTHD